MQAHTHTTAFQLCVWLTTTTGQSATAAPQPMLAPAPPPQLTLRELRCSMPSAPAPPAQSCLEHMHRAFPVSALDKVRPICRSIPAARSVVAFVRLSVRPSVCLPNNNHDAMFLPMLTALSPPRNGQVDRRVSQQPTPSLDSKQRPIRGARPAAERNRRDHKTLITLTDTHRRDLPAEPEPVFINSARAARSSVTVEPHEQLRVATSD